MNNSTNNICRLAIAQKKTDLKRTIVVQIVYVLRAENKQIRKSLINKYSIDIKSINGLVRYKVQGIKDKGKIIIFLYGDNLYILNLNKSLFDR